jgi:probable F420-dependent oxidoreductase
MRAGFALPHLGPAAGAEAVVKVAQQAETLGYASVWVIERLLYPLHPQTPYPGTSGGPWPEVYKRCFDPLATLAFVAGRTSRIALGTSVLDMPYYNPVMLARQLTAIDVFSGGRLRVGLGQGWSKDEYDAAGVVPKRLGRRADEFIQVLKAIWTTDPVEFQGTFFRVPRSTIQPKPVQRPHPPIYLAAYAPSALQRAATRANGWNPVGLPLDALRQMTGSLKQMAQAAGRDAASVEVIVRANVIVTDEPLGRDRGMFAGSLEQIKEDAAAAQQLGVDEIILDPTFSPGVRTDQDFLTMAERLRSIV